MEEKSSHDPIALNSTQFCTIVSLSFSQERTSGRNVHLSLVLIQMIVAATKIHHAESSQCVHTMSYNVAIPHGTIGIYGRIAKLLFVSLFKICRGLLELRKKINSRTANR